MMSHATQRENVYLACLAITIAGAAFVFVLLHITSGLSYKTLATYAVSVQTLEGR